MGQVSPSDLGRPVDNATVRVVFPPDPTTPPVVYEVCDCALPDATHTTEAHYIHWDEDSPLARERGGWAALIPNEPTAIDE